MSVLQSLRGTFQNVQEDIKAGFKSLTRNELRNRLADNTPNYGSFVNIDAGADILNKFQEYWVEIHQNSENNASHAVNVDVLISSLFLQCEERSIHLERMTAELGHLPQIVKDLDSLSTKLGTLDELFIKIETDLVELEDVCESVEFQRNCTNQIEQLRLYKEEKVTSLKNMKVKLSAEHAARVKTYEQRREAVLRERQEAFQDAFQADMDHYKKTGKLERSQSSSSDNPVDIGDIVLDEDEEELDEFLDADNGGHNEHEVAKVKDEDEVSVCAEVKADEDLNSDSEILDRDLGEKTEAEAADDAAAATADTDAADPDCEVGASSRE